MILLLIMIVYLILLSIPVILLYYADKLWNTLQKNSVNPKVHTFIAEYSNISGEPGLGISDEIEYEIDAYFQLVLSSIRKAKHSIKICSSVSTDISEINGDKIKALVNAKFDIYFKELNSILTKNKNITLERIIPDANLDKSYFSDSIYNLFNKAIAFENCKIYLLDEKGVGVNFILIDDEVFLHEIGSNLDDMWSEKSMFKSIFSNVVVDSKSSAVSCFKYVYRKLLKRDSCLELTPKNIHALKLDTTNNPAVKLRG